MIQPVSKPNTVTRRRGVFVALLFGTVIAAAAPGTAAPVVGLPARVVAADAGVSAAVYNGLDYGNPKTTQDNRRIRTSWRIVERTGNCCDNYLATTPTGMLIDFGGNFLNYSQDRGRTWQQVQGDPLLLGEGAVAIAPGGDVLGVGWDLAAGDRMMSFKYEADTKEWRYLSIPLHEPFYDRAWVSVVPGPVTIQGFTYEYVSFIKGGWHDKENWFYSTDGLTYLPMPGPSLGTPEFLDSTVVGGPLPTAPEPLLDWAQSNANNGMTPIGKGRLLARPSLFDDLFDMPGQNSSWAYGLLNVATNTWTAYAPPDGGYVRAAGSRYQVDSAGRLHNVLPAADGTGFAYRMSYDGGVTWKTVKIAFPPGHTMEKDGCGACHGVMRSDFRANRAVGVAAVAVLTHDRSTKTDRTVVYKFDITGDAPKLTRMMEVGLGDVPVGQANSTGARQDFGSIAIFADGRVAVSFVDSTTDWTSPGTNNDPYNVLHYVGRSAPESGATVAIEGDTKFGGLVEPARITFKASQKSVRTSPHTGNTSVLTAAVVDADGHPVAGAPVVFSFANAPSGAPSGARPVMPSLSTRSATTDTAGRATVTYTSGPLPGDDVIEAQTGSSRAVVTITVTAPAP